jgi:hypothetical protein
MFGDLLLANFSLKIPILLTGISAFALGGGIWRIKHSAAPPAASKNIDYEFDRRLRTAEASIGPIEQDANHRLEIGDYAGALSLFREADRKLSGSQLGFLSDHCRQIVECLFGLNRYQDVIALLGEKKLDDDMLSGALGVSLIHVGRADDARRLSRGENSLSAYSLGKYASYLPGDSDPAHLESSFWFVRGITLHFKADRVGAMREFQRANALVPHEPLICYFLLEDLVSLGRWQEARIYLQDSSRLPGKLGDSVQNLRVAVDAHR